MVHRRGSEWVKEVQGVETALMDMAVLAVAHRCAQGSSTNVAVGIGGLGFFLLLYCSMGGGRLREMEMVRGNSVRLVERRHACCCAWHHEHSGNIARDDMMRVGKRRRATRDRRVDGQ